MFYAPVMRAKDGESKVEMSRCQEAAASLSSGESRPDRVRLGADLVVGDTHAHLNPFHNPPQSVINSPGLVEFVVYSYVLLASNFSTPYH